MNYNYNDLFSFFNLQQKKIKDVLTEAQQALEAIEFNRHLLERHSQLTLRLQEISTSLEVTNSRIEEIKGNQRLLSLGIQADKQLPVTSPVKGKFEANPSLIEKTVALENDQNLASVKQDGRASSSVHVPALPQTDSSNPLQYRQLEIIELSNQQVKLKNQKNHFESELSSIEQQLTERGIGPVQG